MWESWVKFVKSCGQVKLVLQSRWKKCTKLTIVRKRGVNQYPFGSNALTLFKALFVFIKLRSYDSLYTVFAGSKIDLFWEVLRIMSLFQRCSISSVFFFNSWSSSCSTYKEKCEHGKVENTATITGHQTFGTASSLVYVWTETISVTGRRSRRSCSSGDPAQNRTLVKPTLWSCSLFQTVESRMLVESSTNVALDTEKLFLHCQSESIAPFAQQNSLIRTCMKRSFSLTSLPPLRSKNSEKLAIHNFYDATISL